MATKEGENIRDFLNLTSLKALYFQKEQHKTSKSVGLIRVKGSRLLASSNIFLIYIYVCVCVSVYIYVYYIYNYIYIYVMYMYNMI